MDPKHEQTTDEGMRRRGRSSKKSEPTPPAEMKIHKAEDEVLDVINHVESQIGALRKAHEEHRKVMADLSQRKRDLEEQSNELESRETELTTREVELAEMRQDFETRELNLVQRASGLEQRESKIATQAEQLEQHEAELETRDQTLEQKISELDTQLAGLAKRKGELKVLEEEIKEKIAREDEAATKLAIALAELEETRATIETMGKQAEQTGTELLEARKGHESALAQLTESQEAHAVSAKELKSTLSKLRGREIELKERSHTLEELAEKAGALEHELSTTREQFEHELVDLGAKLEQEQAKSAELSEQVVSLEQQQEQLHEASTKQIGQLSEQLEQATTQVESMRQAALELGEQSEGRVGELAEELKASKDQVETLNAQINEIARSADEELTSERQRIAELEASIERLTQEISNESAKSASLSAELDAKPEIDPEELTAINAELAKAQERAQLAEEKLEETSGVLVELREQLASGDEQLAKENARIEELESQSTELFQTIEQLEGEIEAANSAPKVDADEWALSRRTRLKKMRRILHGDAEKIRLATDALQTRYEQCEQVLTKRAELAQAYEAIASAQKKYQTREVRSGVFLGLIGIAAITLVLAATSWFVSGRITPGMYAAQVTVAAASGDSQLGEADLELWESYITDLAKDPRFLEIAAERMKRRGISQFAVAGELGKEMEQSFDLVSSAPGTIVMEYRGNGAQRSQRILDTVSVALASAANNARARRADSALTIIEKEAKAGSDPLDTRRIETAGMVFGAGLLLTMVLGGVLWKRLSAAKARFEKDSRIDGLFDDARWELPGSTP
jgi:chromosome segregation ATPase